EDAARELNAPFFHALDSTRPWVTLKLAISLDGAVADAHGASRWITGVESRRETHRLRAGHDAVAVGIGTVLADDPALTVRTVPSPRVPPRRVVFDRQARLPIDSVLVRTADDVPTVVVCHAADSRRIDALRDSHVDIVDAPTLEAALVSLRAMGIRSLLAEGGARLAGSLLGNALVDRLVIFQAPVLLGGGALSAFAYVPPGKVDQARRLAVITRRRLGDDVMTVYRASDPRPTDADCSPDSSTTSER
ncbi:MAG: RibD family protein, partial [Gemmatimonadota bacterium]|nr:RibD family protein [Gemmatimonadota bacterium]